MKVWHAITLLVALVAAAYYPSIAVPFNTLDDLRMVNDLLNRQASVASFLFHPAGSFFRPVVTGSWLVDKALWDLAPSFMHLENLLLHIVNVLLVFLLARITLRQQHDPQAGLLPAFAAALCFGLHPLNTEAVIWVAGRADLFAGMFGFAALYMALAWWESPRWWLLLLALAAFALGCLSKETTLFLLPALFYLVFVLRVPSGQAAPSLSRRLAFAFGFLLVVGSYLVLRQQMLHVADYGLQHTAQVFGGMPSPAVAPDSPAAGPERSLFGTAWYLLAVAGFYCRKLFFPWPLNFGIVEVPSAYAWLGAVVFGASSWVLSRRQRAGLYWLAGLGALIAALLVAVGHVTWTPVAERYMYIPCGMFALLVMQAITLIKSSSAFLLPSAVAVLLGVAGWGVFQRTLLWQDNVRLYEDTLQKSPQFQMARNQLATAWLQRGETDRAMALYEGMTVRADQVASLNPALAMVQRGDLAGARAFLRDRLNTPYTFEIEILRRLLAVLEGMIAEARDEAAKVALYREGIGYLGRLHELTHDPFYWYRMGQYQLAIGDRKSARQNFLRAYQSLPADSIYKEPCRKLAAAMVD